MSIYKCKLIPIDRLPVGPMGPISPLCNSCETRDCSNPIEPVAITVFGSKTTWKVYKKKNAASIVAQCEGYSK
jgi:hypothetical protein